MRSLTTTRRVALLISLVFSTAHASSATPGGLELVVTSTRPAYSEGEDLSLHACLINRGNHAIYIYRELRDGIWLWPYDSDGKALALTFIQEHRPPPPNSRQDFVQLGPSAPVCVDITEPLSHLSLKATGSYTIQAEYKNPCSAEWVKKYFGLTIWEGRIESADTVRISVRPK